jgi:hydrogenase expression/formation protein HypD
LFDIWFLYLKLIFMSLQNILDKIHILAEEIGCEVKLMEVCGTHTQAVAQFGLRSKMPKNVKLITGPGCPVCVTDQRDIDSIIALAAAGVPVATYGDLLRVPGSTPPQPLSGGQVRFPPNKGGKGGGKYCLDDLRAQGAWVKEVYSIEEALKLQKEKSDLVFFGLGFETTTPMSASAVKRGLNIYSTHKLFIPAMKALLRMKELKIDGFLDPGHVSAVVGTAPYYELNNIRPIHQVIAGFEAMDVLIAIYMLLKQIKEERYDVENEYTRLVTKNGNQKAQELINEVFEVGDGIWRGFGVIPGSGLGLRPEYAKQDAKIIYKDILAKVPEPKKTACKCGEVIRGLMDPNECPLFGKTCIPESPYGPCMVSVEGGCNVFYRVKIAK